MVTVVEESEGGRIVHHHPEVGPEAQLDLLLGAGSRRGGERELGQHLEGQGVDQLEVERSLRAEVLVEQRLGDACRLGHVVHGGGAIPPLGEEHGSDAEQLRPALLAGQAPRRGLGGGDGGHRAPRLPVARCPTWLRGNRSPVRSLLGGLRCRSALWPPRGCARAALDLDRGATLPARLVRQDRRR